MNRYLAHRPVVSAIVFSVTCAGSILLLMEQRTHCPAPASIAIATLATVSSKFTKIGKAPTGDESRSRLQFINEQEGWRAQGKSLWHTQDGGKTWELVHEIAPGSREQFHQLHFINSKQGWATFLNYIELYKTGDGGRTWSRVPTPMDDVSGALWTFHVEPVGPIWIAGGIFHPMKLDDACTNNARGSLPNSPSACLKGAVFRSDDDGASWQEQRIPQHVGRFMSITFTDSDHGWVTGDAGVFQTTDRGQTWTRGKFRRECENYFELPDTYPGLTSFVDNKDGWLVLSSGQIAKTSDGGHTWCDLFDPENLWRPDPNYVGPTRQFNSLHFRDAIYGLGLGFDGYIYETVDGGATWRREGSTVRFETVVFSDNTNGWAISKDQDLYRVRLAGVAPDLLPPREEPRQLIDIFTDEDRLFYQGYEVRSFTEKVHDDDKPEPESAYAVLMKNNRRVRGVERFYFFEGNYTQLGLFDLLGQDSEQIIISQTRPRSGRHWVVRVSPDVRVLFDSWDYGVGREEFYVIDIDKDNVYEIVLPVTTFYAMQDKMYIGEIPLPEIIFKYDAKAMRYLPANDRFGDYALYGIERDIDKLRDGDESNYLSRRLRILLRYIYARKAKDGWKFFERSYQRADRHGIEARIRSVLKHDPVYNYLY